MNKSVIVLIILAGIFLVVLFLNNKISQPISIFEGKDSHGCLTSTGYTYDDSIGACVRSWEMKEEKKKEAAQIAVKLLNYPPELVILSVDKNEGSNSFTVHLKKGEQKIAIAINNSRVDGVTFE